MANNLTQLSADLKRVEDTARSAEQQIASLRKELEKLIKESARGGVPTQAGIQRAASGILSGEIDPTKRVRLGGEARTSTAYLTEHASKIKGIVTEYQNLINVLRNVEQELATIKGAMYSIPRVGKATTELTGGFTAEETAAIATITAPPPKKGTKVDTIGIDAEKAAAGMDRLYATMSRYVEMKEKFPQVFEKTDALLKQLGDSSAKVSFKLKELPGGIERLSASVRTSSEAFGPFVSYIDKTGKAITELEARERAAISTQQKFTKEQLEATMATARYQEANKMARKYGFQPIELTTMRTQEPSGVTFLRYEKVNETTGAINRLDLAVDKVGKTIVQTNRRFLDFFSAIARNTAEVIRWSIGATAVYSALFKLQDLVRLAIDNEARLADITVTLGDNQRNVNDIFADAAKIANETGESINGILDAYTMTYRAVGSIEDPIKRTAAANKLLTDATILNKLSTLDAAQSIDVLAGAIRQLQQPNETFDQALERGTKLLDQWVAVTRKANVDLGTIATAFSITAESADNAGVSTEELTAIIASLSEKIGGLGGRETGNAVRAIIGGVYQGQAAEALGRYGVAITNVNGKMRDFLDIMREVASLRDQELISSDQLNKLGYVLGGGVRRGQQYIAFLDDLQRIDQIVAYQTNVQGNAQEALGKKLDTVQTSVTRLSNSFQNLAQAMGERGGVLDTANSILTVMTSLNEIIATITRTLGRVTIPAALLAFAGFYFRGTQGSLKRQEMSLGIQSTFGGLATNMLGFIPGMRQPTIRTSPEQPIGFTRAETLGTSFGGLAAKFGPALLLGILPAISRMGQELTAPEKWKAVGIDLAGGIIGALVGGPVGAIIGSSIADSFASAIIDYKPTLADFFADIFPKPPKVDKKEEKIQETEQIQSDLFRKLGTLPGGIQSADFGKLAAVVGAGIFNAFSRLSKGVGLGGFGQLTPSQISLISATPEQRARLGEIYRETPQAPVQAPAPVATQQERDIVKQIQERARQTQLQQLYAREIKPAEYLKTQQEIQGFLALLPQLESAFGQTFDEISDDISGTEQVYKALADVIIEGSEEDMAYIKSLAGEIEDMRATIEKAGKEGRNTITILDDLGRESSISIGDYTDQMNAKIQIAAQTFAALRREQQLAQVNLPQNIRLEIRPEDLNKVIEEARRLEGLYLAALTPEEREKYDAEQAVAKYLIEMWAKGGQIAYQAISKMGLGFNPPGAEFITQASQGLISQGQIPQAGKNVGLEQINATYSQFAQAMEGYGALMAKLVAAGYTPDEQYQIAVFQDGIIRPMSKDWKIVQMLLQDILDVQKDQLEGIYNLPEGASFYVPFQGYKLGFGQGGGGTAGNINWEAIPGDMQDGTRQGAKDGVIEGFSRMGYQWFGPPLPKGQVATTPVKQGMSSLDWENMVQNLVNKGIPQIQTGQQLGPPAPVKPTPITPTIITHPDLGLTPRTQAPAPETSLSALVLNAITNLGSGMGKFTDINVVQPLLGVLNQILDALNRVTGTEPGRTGFTPQQTGGGKVLAAPTQTPLSYLTQNRNLPKVETKLSLNINSNIQLMVDGRMLAAIIKQYLYEDLIRSEGLSGSITRTIVI